MAESRNFLVGVAQGVGGSVLAYNQLRATSSSYEVAHVMRGHDTGGVDKFMRFWGDMPNVAGDMISTTRAAVGDITDTVTGNTESQTGQEQRPVIEPFEGPLYLATGQAALGILGLYLIAKGLRNVGLFRRG